MRVAIAAAAVAWGAVLVGAIWAVLAVRAVWAVWAVWAVRVVAVATARLGLILWVAVGRLVGAVATVRSMTADAGESGASVRRVGEILGDGLSLFNFLRSLGNLFALDGDCQFELHALRDIAKALVPALEHPWADVSGLKLDLTSLLGCYGDGSSATRANVASRIRVALVALFDGALVTCQLFVGLPRVASGWVRAEHEGGLLANLKSDATLAEGLSGVMASQVERL